MVNKEAVKTFCEEEPSDSSDTESLCGVEEVGAVEDRQKRRPIRCIKVEKCEFQVLVDTGATVDVMDNCSFQELLAAEVTLKGFQVCYMLFKQMKALWCH